MLLISLSLLLFSSSSLTLSSVLAKMLIKMPILLDRCSQNDGFESTDFAFSTNQDLRNYFDMYLCFWTSRFAPRYEIKIVSLESRVLKMVVTIISKSKQIIAFHILAGRLKMI